MRKKEVEPITLKHIIPVQSMLALLYNRQADRHCRPNHDAAIATLLLALCYFEYFIWHMRYAAFPTPCMVA